MKKVLIAEDEAAIREIIGITLRRAGYEVTEACDGQQALDLYNEKNGTEYFTFSEREEKDYEEIFDPNETFEEWGMGCDAIFLDVIEDYEPKDEE
jgi:CheY-like chemotaxis protein